MIACSWHGQNRRASLGDRQNWMDLTFAPVSNLTLCPYEGSLWGEREKSCGVTVRLGRVDSGRDGDSAVFLARLWLRVSRDCCNTFCVSKRVLPDDGVSVTETTVDHEQVVVRGIEPFPLFYAREFRAMVALAYATSGSRLAAEDIAQDALLVAYRDWERIGRLDNPATWVRRVVVNRSVSLIRRRIAAGRMLDRLNNGADPVVLSNVSAETRDLWKAVRSLSRRQRQVVALRHVEQLTLVDIGEVLGLSKDTVNTHLRRGHARLARLVDEEG